MGEAKKAISVGRGGKAWRRAGAHAVSSRERTGSALDSLGSSAPCSSRLLLQQLCAEHPAREYEDDENDHQNPPAKIPRAADARVVS